MRSEYLSLNPGSLGSVMVSGAILFSRAYTGTASRDLQDTM